MGKEREPAEVIPLEILQPWVEERSKEEGECWIWQLVMSQRLPQGKINGKYINVRRYLVAAKNGWSLQGKWVAVCTCDNALCVNPDHLKATTRNKLLLGSKQSPTHVRKVAEFRRSISKITPEIVEDVRYGEGTITERAARNGISRRWAGLIARGEAWKDYTSPFSGLLASNDSRKAA